MCGLCGLFQASHWTDPTAADGRPLRRERQRRAAQAGRVLALRRLTLSDWQGQRFQLAGATGRTELLDNLAEVWKAADGFGGAPLDPLDPALLDALRAAR